MKQKITLIAILFLGISGGVFAQTTYTYHLHPKSQLKLDPARLFYFDEYAIGPGEGLVFEYVATYTEPGNGSYCPEVLVWQIEPGAKKFSYQDASISQVRGHYGQLCLTVDRGFHPLTQGTISGERMKDGNWKVQVEVEAIGGTSGKAYRFDFEAVFEVE